MVDLTRVGDSLAVPLAAGIAMPLVGFGTWRLRGQQGYDAIRHALDVGYRHIDTAVMYGNEADVGRAVRDSGLDRGDVFLTTKLPPGNAGRERQTLTASLRALGTDYIDLWLVHWPPRGKAEPRTWRALLSAREQGLVRAVGVSNYTIGQIGELIGATGKAPMVHQTAWSPYGYDAKLLESHRERGIVLAGHSPLNCTDLRHPILAEIASGHGVSPAQVVLRWHIEHGVPVIPRSADRHHITANFDLSGFTLSDAEVALIDSLHTGS